MFGRFSADEMLGTLNRLLANGYQNSKLYLKLSDEFWDRMLNGEDFAEI